MHKNVSFTARFRTELAGVAFHAEEDCADLAELGQKYRALQSAGDVELVAAQLCFDLSRPDGSGCDLLDEDSEQLMRTLWRSLKVGAEHFFNERLGYYDKLNNRVKPADLGVVFPDGTMRIVWDTEGSATDFDSTLTVLSAAVDMLLQLQKAPYGRQTEEELDANDFNAVRERRIEALFAAGLWPCTDDSFEPLEPQAIADITQQFCRRRAPEAAVA